MAKTLKPRKPAARELPPAERKQVAAYHAVRHTEIMRRYTPDDYDYVGIRVGRGPEERDDG